MHKRLIFLLAIVTFSQYNTVAQQSRDIFYIRGRVINAKTDSLLAFVDDIFESSNKYIPLEKDKSFENTFYVNGLGRVGLASGRIPIAQFYIKPNDSLFIIIDGSNGNILELNGNNNQRTKELNFQKAFNIKFPLSKMGEFEQRMYKIADSLGKIRMIILSSKKIATQFPVLKNRGINTIAEITLTDSINKRFDSMYREQLIFILEHYDKAGSDLKRLIDDAYFSLLNSKWMLTHDTSFIFLKKPVGIDKNIPVSARKFIPPNDYHKILSNDILERSAGYRTYLFDYVRFAREPKEKEMSSFKEIDYKQSDYATREYIQGLLFFKHNFQLMNWYLAASVKFSFQHYNVLSAEKLYYDYQNKSHQSKYARLLTEFYNSFTKFKPGSPAPGFTLKNEDGNNVSLGDFKGKVVFIDFWGVHCGPCIAEIKSSIPVFQEKYKEKDIVFINICIDETPDVWRKSLKDLKLTGVNLIAAYGDEVTKAYGINGIPHHILIDKNGKFINYNAEIPITFTVGYQNDIDKALQ